LRASVPLGEQLFALAAKLAGQQVPELDRVSRQHIMSLRRRASSSARHANCVGVTARASAIAGDHHVASFRSG
jgi:hypothetical protein